MSRASHPEATADEVFIGNIWRSDFSKIGWKTKRLGRIAYASDGREIPKHQAFSPVFASREEVEAAGVAIPDTGVIDHCWHGKLNSRPL
jgi:hypothetical protein